MNIYKIILSFKDYIYFTSREENRSKITIPILHNIALQYAFNNVKGKYRLHDFIPSYQKDFQESHVNQKFYIYPAISIMSQNTLTAHSTNILFGWQSEKYRTFNELSSTNMLQFTNVILLDPENTFITYISSEMAYDEMKRFLPAYIRSGKTRGKIKVDVEKINFNEKENYVGKTNWWINPLDLPRHLKMGRDYVGTYFQMLPNGLFFQVIFKSPISIFQLENGIIIPKCVHFQNL